jgi:23S rRNA maturation-related 3'-5' exoribonuclease YhaM
MALHYLTQQRPITDALRRTVTEDLPEIAEIGNADLRRKAVEAWAFALSHSSFGRISDIEPGGNPGMNVLKRGSQADHLRGVARLALQIVDTFIAQRPEVCINHTYWSVAGALGLLTPESLRPNPILRVRRLTGELVA